MKNETTSNRKYYQVLSSLFLNDVGIVLRDGPFESDRGIVNLHRFKGSHWVAYINGSFSDSYGHVPPVKLSKLNIKQNGLCVYSGYKIQGLTGKRDSNCASFFYIYILLDKNYRFRF